MNVKTFNHNDLGMPSHGSMRTKTMLRNLLGILTIILPLVAGCHRAAAQVAQPAAPAANAIRVPVITPQQKTIRRIVEQPATIEAIEVANLHPRIAGHVDRVLVDMGDRVRGPKLSGDGQVADAGQVLVTLYVPELRAEFDRKRHLVTQAQADVQQAQAAVKVAEAGVASAEARQAGADAVIRRASADVQRRRSELARITELESRAAVTPKLLDESRDQFAATEAAEAEAKAQLLVVQAGVHESRAALAKAQADVVAADARVQVAHADALHAQSMWNYHELRSPFDGVVTRRSIHAGHLAQPGVGGEPMLVVARMDKVRIFVNVPESDSAQVEPGDPIDIRLPAQGGLTISGKITRTSWSLEPSARTLRAEVEFDNVDGRLRPGMYGYASIVAAVHEQALVLPASAVFADKLQSYCVCLENGVLRRKPIVLGLRDSTEVEILQGLTGREKVVRANASSLADGQPATAITAP